MGINEINQNLDKIMRDIEKKTEKAIAEIGQDLLDKTIQVTPISPIKSSTSGDLRKSGKLKMTKSGKATEAEVSFGGGKVDYALYVHEMPPDNNFSEVGTGSKFLEKTLDKNKKKYIEHIAKQTRL